MGGMGSAAPRGLMARRVGRKSSGRDSIASELSRVKHELWGLVYLLRIKDSVQNHQMERVKPALRRRDRIAMVSLATPLSAHGMGPLLQSVVCLY